MDATVTFKDGSTHTYQGVPDGTAPDVVEAQAVKEFGKPVVSLSGGAAQSDQRQPTQSLMDSLAHPIDTAVDMARSLPGGLAKGVAGLASQGAQLVAMLNPATAAMSLKNPEVFKAVQQGSQTINQMPAKPIPGINPEGGYYQPKTIPGQYAETAASFAPNAVMPGSLPARAARTLIPAVASETAGQLTKGSKYEPLARAAGAVVGGVGEGVGEGLLSKPPAGTAPPSPTVASVKAAATKAYQTVDNSGMEISQPAMQTLAEQAKLNLAGMGFNDKNISSLAPKTAAALGDLQDSASSTSSLQGLEMQRRIAGLAAGAVDKTDRQAARVIQDTIDDFVKNMGPEHLTGAPDQAALDALPQARDLWGRAARAQTIQDTIDKAGMKMGGQSVFSPTLDQSIRTKFGTLASNARAMSRFSPEEQQMIQKVATGGGMMSARNLLTNVGRLSPQSVIPAMVEGGAAMVNPMLGAIPAAGFGARVGATAMTKGAARDALLRTLMGGQQQTVTAAPAASAAASSRFSPAVLAALLSQSAQPGAN